MRVSISWKLALRPPPAPPPIPHPVCETRGTLYKSDGEWLSLIESRWNYMFTSAFFQEHKVTGSFRFGKEGSGVNQGKCK